MLAGGSEANDTPRRRVVSPNALVTGFAADIAATRTIGRGLSMHGAEVDAVEQELEGSVRLRAPGYFGPE